MCTLIIALHILYKQQFGGDGHSAKTGTIQSTFNRALFWVSFQIVSPCYSKKLSQKILREYFIELLIPGCQQNVKCSSNYPNKYLEN